MVRRFDHLTIVVRDLDRARRFFALLGFKEAVSVVITGEPFASYMGVPEIEADHVTLVLENATPRTEIQLLHYRHPESIPIRISVSYTRSASTTFASPWMTSRPKFAACARTGSRPGMKRWTSIRASSFSWKVPRGW